MKRIISKPLSRNDLGLTGSHQSGMCIPRGLVKFFPNLDSKEKNPRIALKVCDKNNEYWQFNYIYYNNKLFGGTRNEYRMTRMTSFFKKHNLKHGDRIQFMCASLDNEYNISVIANNSYNNEQNRSKSTWHKRTVIISDWEVEV